MIAPSGPTPSPPLVATPPETGPATGPAWPDATTTGVPQGVALTNSGGMTITEAGKVLDRLDIRGSVTIAADNVTIRRSRIRDNGFTLIRIADRASGARIEDVEVDGMGRTDGTSNSMGILGSATVIRANIHGVENGFQPGSGSSISDSYIHDLGAPGSPHYDGIQIDGGQSDVSIRRNFITVPSQTAAVMIDNYGGGASNITVDGNKLVGGTYTVYSDAQFGGGPITDVRITNNRFGKSEYGRVLIRKNMLAAADGNLDDATGQAITL